MAGINRVLVPPHVFAVDGERLRYGCFESAPDGFRCSALEFSELPPNTFQNGPLGGPIRDPVAFQGFLQGFMDELAVAPADASLVVPDRWLRVVFAEFSELPRNGGAREEVLRWKLRRLQPFRIDDLRVNGVEVAPLPLQEEPKRVLLGFGMELLLSQLEEAFQQYGVRFGQILSASLALVGAVSYLELGVDSPNLTGLVLVEADGYSLVMSRRGELVLHRYKALRQASDDPSLAALVTRDLRLTHTFLEDKLPGLGLERMLVVAPPELEGPWLEWLDQSLGAPAEPLDLGRMAAAGDGAGAGGGEAEVALPWVPLHEVGPLVGAASREIA